MDKKLKTIYTFSFGRNIYTIRLSDIRKVTLLQHDIIERENDVQKVTETFFIFSVLGDFEPCQKDEEVKQQSLLEVKSIETDYITIYKVYEDLMLKWDEYQQSII